MVSEYPPAHIPPTGEGTVHNGLFWATESRLGARTTDTLVKLRTTAPARANVRHTVRSNTFTTDRTPPAWPTCARTHAPAAWDGTNRSAIVLGLPSAPRLGGKTWRQAPTWALKH